MSEFDENEKIKKMKENNDQENMAEPRQYIGGNDGLHAMLRADGETYRQLREKELALQLFKSIPFLWRTVETFKECLMVVREKDLSEEFEGFEEAEKIEMPAVAIKLCNVCSRNLSSAG